MQISTSPPTFSAWIASLGATCHQLRLRWDHAAVDRRRAAGVPADRCTGWVWEAQVQLASTGCRWQEVPAGVGPTVAEIEAHRIGRCALCVGARMCTYNRHGTIERCPRCGGTGDEPPACGACGTLPPSGPASCSCYYGPGG